MIIDNNSLFVAMSIEHCQITSNFLSEICAFRLLSSTNCHSNISPFFMSLNERTGHHSSLKLCGLQCRAKHRMPSLSWNWILYIGNCGPSLCCWISLRSHPWSWMYYLNLLFYFWNSLIEVTQTMNTKQIKNLVRKGMRTTRAA